jgi:hypothetical protein
VQLAFQDHLELHPCGGELSQEAFFPTLVWLPSKEVAHSNSIIPIYLQSPVS